MLLDIHREYLLTTNSQNGAKSMADYKRKQLLNNAAINRIKFLLGGIHNHDKKVTTF